MDDLARRYLLLGLRMGRLVPGFIDSYVGPGELAEAVRSEDEPLPQDLHDEGLRLTEVVEALPAESDAQRRRRRWFAGQLTAIRTQAREAAGEEIAFLDLCDQLFGLRVTPVPDAELRSARDRLDAALPGRGSIAERMAAARERLRVPDDQTLEALAASAARFRDVTRRDFALPDDEGIDWAAARDQPWGASARFLGRGRTRVEINLSLPRDVPVIAYLASHEAYPGHHAEHISKERTLIRDAGLGEATLRTMNTPEGVLAEGGADVAREVVMGDWELEDELRRIGRSIGIDADWPAIVAVSGAAFALAGAVGNAAIMLHHDELPEAEVRDWLAEVNPALPELTAHAMRILRDPTNRTYAFTYREGARLIRPWLALQGQTTGFARLLTEQLSPGVLIDDLAEADVAAAPR